jgi:hypothetical protein
MSDHHSEVPLSAISEWPRKPVEALEACWINTADQVVAMAATAAGLRALAEEAGVGVPEMERLVVIARSYLHPAVAERLDEVVDPANFGFGALPPEPDP